MQPIAYFKLQAKNLFRDFKTKAPYIDPIDGNSYYQYSPTYFDVDGIVVDFDWDEESFCLANSQHTIAILAGFKKWTDLVKASEVELDLGRLLFDNQHKISADEWGMYISNIERDNQISFDSEARLEIFKDAFVNVEGYANSFSSYLLKRQKGTAPDSFPLKS